MKTFKPLALALTIALIGCKKPESQRAGAAAPTAREPQPTSMPVATATTKYHARGRVVRATFSKAGEGVSIVVDHEDIPGLMDAMRMQFRLIDPAIASRFHPGDKIAFDLAEQPEGDEAVTRVTPLPADTPLRLAPAEMPSTAPVTQPQQ